MKIELPLEGGCVCGALRYRVKELPLAVFICHCTNCKKRTGSAFSLAMISLRKDFEKVSGETLWCDSPGGSGAMHRQHVCSHCLTRTHTDMHAYPDIVNVRPGTLDRPHQVTPIAQCWVSEAQPWALSAGIRSFAENPSDVPSLMSQWRKLHG